MRLESMTGDEMNTSATLPAEAPDTSPRPRVAPFPPSQLEEIRRTRRYPRRTDPYYLILRILVLHLESVLREIRHPVNDVLDLYCGTQPYRDLLPPHTRYVSLDIDERYGVPDVVSDEFLPFPDASFDLILFTEAFHYVTDPAHAVAELRRVLRPEGTLVLTVPLVWEYDRRIVERRYTGPHLQELFQDWDETRVIENGGYSVAWATLSNRTLHALYEAAPQPFRLPLKPAVAFATLGLNLLATLLARGEPRWGPDPFVLPMDLMVVARRPRD
jgi:SAM-dependent methyltransferase